MIGKPILWHFLVAILLVTGSCYSCNSKEVKSNHLVLEDTSQIAQKEYLEIVPGAYNLSEYIPKLKSKNVGLVVNHTSRVGDLHLMDTLFSLGIDVMKIFTPEHGFTGTADAGELVENQKIEGKKDIEIISLYGQKKMPDEEDLADLDIMVFDIQDVGVRFYTYISTLHYIMEACAENDIPLIVLDRPNPNGHYVDGPVLEDKFKSFVGMHPIPVVYGMTIGELALMINGEAWLKNGIECDLTIIKNVNYSHLSHYNLPIAPSPNLPDQLAVTLYPSLCFFEGTPISVGRGTDRPFTLFGHPAYSDLHHQFVPIPNEGASSPKLQDQTCYGYDLDTISMVDFRAKSSLNLAWLIEMYNGWHGTEPFFNEDWFDKLAGTDQLRNMILKGKSEQEIRDSWAEQIDEFKAMRKSYLLYDDFE